ncbi:hypothetical protein K3495_g3495 [Podosphaera aphanis]|nr:hypothetical protein K3495_g3495 [Podosphaera aphanis]
MTSLKCLSLMIAIYLIFARATSITSSVAAGGVGLAVNISPCSNQACYTASKPVNSTKQPRSGKIELQNTRPTVPNREACNQSGQDTHPDKKILRPCSCANPTSKSPCSEKYSQLHGSSHESTTIYDGQSNLDLARSLRAPKAPVESILALGVAMGFLLCLA